MPYGAHTIGSMPSGNVTSSLHGESPGTSWNNPIFKARLLPLTDLADRGVKPTPKKPTNDLLDNFKRGDIIKGIGYKDRQVYKGIITRIEKNTDGDGYTVFIKNSSGHEIELLPSSLTYAKRSDRMQDELRGIITGNRDARGTNRSGSNQYTIPIEENLYLLNKLKKFESFNFDIYSKINDNNKMAKLKKFEAFEYKINEADDLYSNPRQAIADMANYELEIQKKGKERIKLAKEWIAATDEKREEILEELRELTLEMDELKKSLRQSEKDFNIASGIEIDETEDPETDYSLNIDEDEFAKERDYCPDDCPDDYEDTEIEENEEELDNTEELDDEDEYPHLVWKREN